MHSQKSDKQTKVKAQQSRAWACAPGFRSSGCGGPLHTRVRDVRLFAIQQKLPAMYQLTVFYQFYRILMVFYQFYVFFTTVLSIFLYYCFIIVRFFTTILSISPHFDGVLSILRPFYYCFNIFCVRPYIKNVKTV